MLLFHFGLVSLFCLAAKYYRCLLSETSYRFKYGQATAEIVISEQLTT